MTELKEMRFEPKKIETMKDEWVKTLERIPGDGLKGKFAPTNVLGMLMHNPDTVGQFLDYWVTSKLKMGLSVREQEIVILRMGVLYNCNYVWKHHIPVAKEFGITNEELSAIKKEEISEEDFVNREEALIKLTDEFVKIRTISDNTWNKYNSYLSPSEVIDLVNLVSQYVLFALTNNVLNVEIEEPLAEIESL